MKKIMAVLAIGMALMAFQSPPQPPVADKIQWLTLEEAFIKTQKEPRKILIDVYTDWCGWCKRMDSGTFADPAVVAYVNEHYYAVKFDAESKEAITIGDKTYKYIPENRSHEAAIALLQGKMSYPTVVYLDERFNMIQPIPGYMDAKQFHQVITFLGGNFHKSEPFDQYVKSTYKEKYP